MTSELLIANREAHQAVPTLGFSLANFAGALVVAEHVVGRPLIQGSVGRVQSLGMTKGSDFVLVSTCRIKYPGEKVVTIAIQRVQQNRPPGSGNTCLSTAHESGEQAVIL